MRRRHRRPPDEPLVEPPRGAAALVLDAEHRRRVVDRLLSARFAIALATADLKAMRVPDARGGARSVIALLADRARAGVEVRVLHAGVPSRAALGELRGELPERLTFRRCPRVHTKAVIVDAEWMYLGSANLTGAGLGAKGVHRRNFEAGVFTSAGELIDPVLGWFDALWEGRYCEPCGRRDVCPVPLEEPDL
jgi:phosphatidylserine/phosphatidylglycerophosphate/cardiolipin synthase-like enzyme